MKNHSKIRRCTQNLLKFFRSMFSEKTFFYLIILSGFSIFLSLCRIIYTGRAMYAFLIWNLFLAFVPFLIANIVTYRKFGKKTEILFLLLWFIFFPNAPYILSDFIHLGKQPFAPRWFDLILILSYGLTGLGFGFSSFKKIKSILQRRFSKINIFLLNAAILYITSYGIYIGRFLRWNSWDIFSNFIPLMKDIFTTVVHPIQNAAAWGFTFLFGTLLNILFVFLDSVSAVTASTSASSVNPANSAVK